jgi:hypothetical protein
MHEKTFRDYVAEQAADMVAQLETHAEEKGAPGTWFDGDPLEWCRRADRQLMMLRQAIHDRDLPGILIRAAHVCNYMMMASQAARSQNAIEAAEQ